VLSDGEKGGGTAPNSSPSPRTSLEVPPQIIRAHLAAAAGARGLLLPVGAVAAHLVQVGVAGAHVAGEVLALGAAGEAVRRAVVALPGAGVVVAVLSDGEKGGGS
jgi:hypothetical protein